MTQPRKSIAELLRRHTAAKAEANPIVTPAPIKSGSPREAEPVPEAITRAEPTSAGPMNANESKPRLQPRPFNPIPANKICGARTRAGTPCKSTSLYRSGRCKNHGGMSTGPRSAEGKARVAMNGRAPKKAKPMGTGQNLTSEPERT